MGIASDGMTFVLIIAIVGAMFVAFNNGANDVANAFASAVGGKALKLRHALIIAAVLNFLGSVVLGGNVSKTLIDGITNVRYFQDHSEYIAGMLSCMIAAGSFILISTNTGLPVSSTHAIVGGLTGVALTIGGWQAVNWNSLVRLSISWLLTPVVTAAISLGTIKLIRFSIYRGPTDRIMQRATKWLPIFASTIVLAVTIAICHGIKFCSKAYSAYTVIGFSLVCWPIAYILLRNITNKLTLKFADRKFGIEHVFKRFQAGSSCLIGFAIGSNDVANSVTPVVAIYFISQIGTVPTSFANYQIPTWLLAIGGLGMSIGVLSLGHKVIGTLGKNITLLTNSRGFSVDFATAMTIILGSTFGIPISSTQAATGSIIGVGMEKGYKDLNLRLLLKIFTTWIITIPLSGIFTVVVYGILRVLMRVFL